MLSAFSQGAYASLPPVGQLLLQCALIKLVWNPAGICKMPVSRAVWPAVRQEAVWGAVW